MITDHDERSRRCPRLGHPVRFQYCRTQADQSLCPRILDCWWESFDVRAFLQGEGWTEELAALENPAVATPKLASLTELIEKARERSRRSG